MALPKTLRSTADPTKISLTLKAFFSTLIPAVIMFAGLFGTSINPTDLQTVADSFINAVAAVWFAGSAIVALYGALRRVYNLYLEPIVRRFFKK